MVKLLTFFFLVFQGPSDDVADLRGFLGLNYRSVLARLEAKNQILLRNTERLAPQQAAEMRSRWSAPASIETPVLSLSINNVGQGLVTFLFEDDFLTERVNIVFCPAGATSPERVMTLQVLFDESRTLGTAPEILEKVYGMPISRRPTDHQPALPYPLRPQVQVTYWDLGSVEAVYDPYRALWITDKRIAATCSPLPKLPEQ